MATEKPKMFAAAALLGISLALLGCAGGAQEPEADAAGDEFLADGKADSAVVSECEAIHVIAWLNDPATTLGVLRSNSITARAARNIAVYRAGADGKIGTADDGFFWSLEDLDGVPYVGRETMKRLAAAVRVRCAIDMRVAVFFAPASREESYNARVIQLIDSAAGSIDIAMYSFRETGILDALERAAGRGVVLRMIFDPASEDAKNPEGTFSAGLEDRGIDVRYVNKIMHHKFAIFDGPQRAADQAFTATLVTGSGNWSSASYRFDENMVELSGDAELVLRFQKEFNLLWKNARDFVWRTLYPFSETMPVLDPMIPDFPFEHAFFTSDNFETRSSSYGPTFTLKAGRNTVADVLAAHIRSAGKSIHVASGHMRSKPVTDALLAAAAANPSLDVRIYLDAQEYVSKSTHAQELRNQESCVAAAAGNVSKVRECYDKEMHYAYAAFEAGIPLRFKVCAYRWDYSYVDQMHHKYMVIDGSTLLTGSYNLSDNAEHATIENMSIFDRSGYLELVDSFERNFERIWETGRQEDMKLYGDLIDLVRNTDENIPIVFSPMALDTGELAELKRAISEACPAVNSQEYRDSPSDHRYCSR